MELNGRCYGNHEKHFYTSEKEYLCLCWAKTATLNIEICSASYLHRYPSQTTLPEPAPNCHLNSQGPNATQREKANVIYKCVCVWRCVCVSKLESISAFRHNR